VKVCGTGSSVRAFDAENPKIMKRRKYMSQLFFIEILQISPPNAANQPRGFLRWLN
jgi:hypothetical protein